jgi:hypothetical protein
MKADQINIATAAVPRDLQEILHALEPRLARQLASDIPHFDGNDRVDDDLSLVHPIPATHLDMRPCPDTDRASNPPTPNSLAETFGEHHGQTKLSSYQFSVISFGKSRIGKKASRY